MKVHLASSARSEHRVGRFDRDRAAGSDVELVQAVTAIVLDAKVARRDQLDCAVILENGDIRMVAYALSESADDSVTSSIGGVDDASAAVATLAREMKAQLRRNILRERYTLLDQPNNCSAPCSTTNLSAISSHIPPPATSESRK